MPSSRVRKAIKSGEPHEHHASSGFCWSATYPDRAAALGQRKPKVIVASEGFDDLYIPVPVARKLESADSQEPQSHAELMYMIRELGDTCAWERLVDMVSRREYSSKEAEDKLVRDGFTRDCARRAIEKAITLRIINDERFAGSFIRMKLSAGWGLVRIERELAHRGVTLSDVAGWPEEFLDDESPEDRALELLERRRIPEKNPYQKLVRFLCSKGYPISVCTSVVSDYLSRAREDGAF